MGVKAGVKPLKFIVKRRSPGPPSSAPADPYDWNVLYAQLMDVSRAIFLSSKRLDQIMRPMDRPSRLAVYSVLEGVVLPGTVPPELSEAENVAGSYILPARTELEAIAQEYSEAKAHAEKRSVPLPAPARRIGEILACHRRINGVIRNLSRLQGAIRSGRLDPRQPVVRREYASQTDVWEECDRRMARLLGIEKTPSGDLRANGRYISSLSEAIEGTFSPGAQASASAPSAVASALSSSPEGYRLKGRYVIPIFPLARASVPSGAGEPESGPLGVPSAPASRPPSSAPSSHPRRLVRSSSIKIPVRRLPSLQPPAYSSPLSEREPDVASGFAPSLSGRAPMPPSPSGAVPEYASDLLDLLAQPASDIAEKVMVVSELAKLAPERARLPAALHSGICSMLERLSRRDPNVSLRIIAREAALAWSGRKA